MLESRGKDGSSTKYWGLSAPNKAENGALVISDFSIVPSLVVINPAMNPMRVFVSRATKDNENYNGPKSVFEVPRHTVQEFSLSQIIDGQTRLSQVTDTHGMHASLLHINLQPFGEGEIVEDVVGLYIVYRNRGSGKFVSASCVS